MILFRFKKDPSRDAAQALFAAAVEQARNATFYDDFAVADTVEGRFELLCVHVWLVLRRLKKTRPNRLSRHVVDALVASLDGSLREMGVGDLSVGRKMRGLIESFYGRLDAYERAVAGENDALSRALARNVFGSDDAKHADRLAAYVERAVASLAAIPDGRTLSGIIDFPTPDGP